MCAVTVVALAILNQNGSTLSPLENRGNRDIWYMVITR